MYVTRLSEQSKALEAEGRCFSYHYMSGCACQREAKHDGIHVAQSDIGKGVYLNGYYLWNHTRGDVECNQTRATPEQIATYNESNPLRTPESREGQ